MLFALFIGQIGHAQSKTKSSTLIQTRFANEGRINVYAIGLGFYDSKQSYKPHQFRGLYPSMGFELQELDYEVGAFRSKYNFELLSDVLYHLIAYTLVGDKNILEEDLDNRWANPSYFTGGFLEAILGCNVLSRDKFNIGLGMVIYDLAFNFNDLEIHANEPSREILNMYSANLGWAVFADFLIAPSFTFHADFFSGYSLWHDNQEKLAELAYSKRPLDSWKATASLLHESGLNIGFRWHQLINKTDIPLAPARLQVVLGYKLGS